MNITICVTFFEGKGHCNVNVIPSEYETFLFSKTSCADYELPPGSYDIAMVGVSPPGGTLLEVHDDNDILIGKKEIKKEGFFSKFLTITI